MKIAEGQGLFETVKIEDGKILHLEDHYDRLSKSLVFFKMPMISFATFKSEIMTCYKASHQPVVKVICLKSQENIKVIVSSRDNVYTKDNYLKGYHLKKSNDLKDSKNIMLQHKTTAIEKSFIEKDQLLKQGFQESIHFNEHGFMTEGIFSNVFFIKNKKIYTPHISCGVLLGIQRKNILKLIKKLGLFCEIGYYKEEVLYFADEVFMTNAVVGIIPVSKYEQCDYDLNHNHITKSLMEAYNNGLL